MTEKLPLTVEIAQRMYNTGDHLPSTTKDEIRHRYETMADEARTVIAERLEHYADSVARICVDKKHIGSTPGTTETDPGTPCAQCRKQIRYTKMATRIVAPDAIS